MSVAIIGCHAVPNKQTLVDCYLTRIDTRFVVGELPAQLQVVVSEEICLATKYSTCNGKCHNFQMLLFQPLMKRDELAENKTLTDEEQILGPNILVNKLKHNC